MPISDRVREQLEANTTSGSMIAKASLGLAVLCFQYQVAEMENPRQPYSPLWGRTQTNARATSISVSDTAIVNELKRIYAELVENQAVLHPEDSRLLHENLWDLYA